MVRRTSGREGLPIGKRGAAAPPPAGEGFRPEWLDFERGIRVGNLEPQQRITQVLKLGLESRHRASFVIDRWGRGVFWQWICWLPRANREAKPLSNKVNFGCAKLFISIDQKGRIFKSGLQIERGYARGPEPYPGCLLRSDWDWHRLIEQCEPGTTLDRELLRLVREAGFVVQLGGFEASASFVGESFTSARQIRDAAKGAPRQEWLGFQLYYPMPEAEVRACSGRELVEAVLAVFAEVVPAMNCCMQVALEGSPPARLGLHA
jgi:hypothetical protein